MLGRNKTIDLSIDYKNIKLLTVSDGDSGFEAGEMMTVVRHELDLQLRTCEDLPQQLESVGPIPTQLLGAVRPRHFHVVVATPVETNAEHHK